MGVLCSSLDRLRDDAKAATTATVETDDSASGGSESRKPLIRRSASDGEAAQRSVSMKQRRKASQRLQTLSRALSPYIHGLLHSVGACRYGASLLSHVLDWLLDLPEADNKARLLLGVQVFLDSIQGGNVCHGTPSLKPGLPQMPERARTKCSELEEERPSPSRGEQLLPWKEKKTILLKVVKVLCELLECKTLETPVLRKVLSLLLPATLSLGMCNTVAMSQGCDVPATSASPPPPPPHPRLAHRKHTITEAEVQKHAATAADEDDRKALTTGITSVLLSVAVRVELHAPVGPLHRPAPPNTTGWPHQAANGAESYAATSSETEIPISQTISASRSSALPAMPGSPATPRQARSSVDETELLALRWQSNDIAPRPSSSVAVSDLNDPPHAAQESLFSTTRRRIELLDGQDDLDGEHVSNSRHTDRVGATIVAAAMEDEEEDDDDDSFGGDGDWSDWDEEEDEGVDAVVGILGTFVRQLLTAAQPWEEKAKIARGISISAQPVRNTVALAGRDGRPPRSPARNVAAPPLSPPPRSRIGAMTTSSPARQLWTSVWLQESETLDQDKAALVKWVMDRGERGEAN